MAERQKGVGQGRQRTKVVETVADVKSILSEASDELNLSRLAQTVLSQFGGAERLGAELRKEFDEAKSGGIARSNALKSVLAIINLGAPKSNVTDVSNLTDEDLERTIATILAKVMKQGEVGGGPQEVPASPAS